MGYLVIAAPIGYERAEEQIKSFDLGLSFVKNSSHLSTQFDNQEVTSQEEQIRSSAMARGMALTHYPVTQDKNHLSFLCVFLKVLTT